MRILIALLSISFIAFANLNQAPENFKKDGSLLVFVDFKTVDVKLNYDMAKSSAMATSTISFYQPVEGKPIFDLVPRALKAVVDGKQVSVLESDMKGTSNIKYLDKVLTQGIHTLEITNIIEKNVSFQSNYVKSAFWMSDLSDRRYIEQYLPSNMEFDQYKMTIDLEIIGTQTDHVLYTNALVTELAPQHWFLEFREVYTASSFFMHITRKGMIPELKKDYQSIDGRIIPVTVYTEQSTTRFMNLSLEYLAELEKDYGPFPHDKVVVYGAGSGGMEHAGATITSLSALGHELIHSYFARGVMPAHGNSGWVDEAIASWRDSDYNNTSSWWLSRSKMAGHSPYKRTTDRDAYSKGKRFLGYLNKMFEDKGKDGLKLFLREFFTTRVFKPFKTPEFKAALEQYYNQDLSEEFDKYIYGTKGVDKSTNHTENPMHPILTDQDLINLL